MTLGNEQLSLDFNEPPAPPSSRRRNSGPDLGKSNLYFAVLPQLETANIAAHLADQLRREHRLSGHPRPARLLHISVYGLGRFDTVPDDIVHAAMESAVAVQMAPFELALDSVLSFRQEVRPLVLRGAKGREEIRSLRAELRRGLRGVGLEGEAKRQFEPHMTLLYDRKAISETSLEKPIAWTVREFVLVHSLIGQSKHDYLGRWSLHLQ
ncbi:2'-5' RNA ligase family protein [Rhizobium tubonense]|uniref:2'-5' RNA ligase n=1 Tax=Rhizobium tubonense TaxID=484088 RepID=A0A2W4ENG6_9HYPH|nr:2'-5' RNA ligase family protein [Rhizobium tubonense]PZM12260.1 2'-5' RNA ligase [Rhizobium tubonense]